MTTQNDRVEKSTPDSLNQKIEHELKANIDYYSKLDKAALSKRIADLEKEWYMDRMLITNASALAGIGVALAATVHKKWLILPGVVLAFLLQHGLQGWCPPLPLFRKFGVRSFKEIDRERYALKFLRGDFNDISDNPSSDADGLYKAVSK
jgi:hypothetical protein